MPRTKRNKYKKKSRKADASVTSIHANKSDLSDELQNLSLTNENNDNNCNYRNNNDKQEEYVSLYLFNDKCKIAYSDIYGRYLIAKRNLKAGEILIKEKPLVIGPCVASESVCLGCYKPVTLKLTQYRCSNCHWPMCERQCPGFYQLLGHTTQECDILKREQTAKELHSSTSLEKIKNLYELIIILRIMLMKQNDLENYAKILQMESHIEKRKSITKLWQHYEENVVKRLRHEWHMADEYNAEEIHMICGILDVNCFEIGQNSAKARTLYPSAFLLAHNCCPNTAHTDHPETYEIILRTSTNIKKHEAITLSYAYTLQGTLKRREFMQAGKLFWCTCDRCKDPYELDTDCSALKCQNCKRGFIRSTEPLNQTAEWRCDNCRFAIMATEIVNILEKIDNDLGLIDVHNVVGLENFLQRYCEILGPPHYLLLSAKYSLCQIYGRIEGYLLTDMSLADLKRKETYCREFLDVINKLEPGLTRLRGLILYELHAPIMLRTQYLMAQKLINRCEFNNSIKEVTQLLRESSHILLMEPKGSSEYEMGLAARTALQEMGVK